jgi:hypothetical protein
MMMKGILERALEVVDVEKITKDVMANLAVKDLELYFIVYQLPDSDEYEMVGLAYSKQAAKLLCLESSKKYPCKILKLDLGKALTLAEQAGIVEEVE